MLFKLDYGAEDKKQFDEIHIDLPGLKAVDPTLFISIRYVNKKTGVTSSEQLLPVEEICDPEEDDEEIEPIVKKLEKTINHDTENAGQSPKKPISN